mmetsp:Transcript_78003/g.95513  ORF Transcript_78003/g.95513 Transcript_78003/m.95513 type:complete len:325 (+) Transcript_78003:73-1047(+)
MSEENTKTFKMLAIISLFVYIFGICGALVRPQWVNSQWNDGNTQVDNTSSLSPDEWIFGLIWGIIYLNGFVWHIYFIWVLFKKEALILDNKDNNEYVRDNFDGYLMYTSLKGKLFFGFFMLSNVFQFGWWISVAFGQYLVAAIIITFFFLAVLGMNIYPHQYFYEVNKYGLSSRIPSPLFYKISFLNLNQMYPTWLWLATWVSWSGVAVSNGLDKETSGLIFTIIALIPLIIYFILDLYFWKDILQYTYTTYAVCILAFFANLTRFGFDFTKGSQIISLLAMIAIIILVICKTVFIGIKGRNKPNNADGNNDTNDQSGMTATQI